MRAQLLCRTVVVLSQVSQVSTAAIAWKEQAPAQAKKK